MNVRHILCEKHSKATEALQKIQVDVLLLVVVAFADHWSSNQEGQRFDEVAQEYSEDKAKGTLPYV